MIRKKILVPVSVVVLFCFSTTCIASNLPFGIIDAVESARQKKLTLEQAKKAIQLKQYKTYMMYDRINLDIEAYWIQIENGRN